MNVCLISKYPPIEGGESSKAYWLAKGLGERGHRIHIITNALEVEDIFRENLASSDLNLYKPNGVTVHNTDPFEDLPYIPFAKAYTEKLASLAIDTIRSNDLEIIDSWYILPYGISGYLVKQITQKPQILRHAGSDITRLFKSSNLNTLFREILLSADRLVTYPEMEKNFVNMGVSEGRIFLNTKVSVDTNAFNPSVKPFILDGMADKAIDENIPIITYIGKVGVTKGVFDLTNALSKIKRDFLILWVCGGKGLNELKEDVKKKKLLSKSIFLGFVPPWRIPSIMKLSTCIVMPEREFPIQIHTPILQREAMCTGKCTVVSEELFGKRRYRELENGVHTIVVNPKDVHQFSKEMERIIQNPEIADDIGEEAFKVARQYEDFEGYIDSMERLYEETLDKH